jgi:hypothetical protein
MLEREIGPATASNFGKLLHEVRKGFMPEPHATGIVDHEFLHWSKLPAEADATIGVLEQEMVVKGPHGSMTINVNVGAFVRIRNINILDPDKVIESAEAVGSEMSDADKEVAREAKIRKYKMSLERVKFGKN